MDGNNKYTAAIIGARGYVGSELIKLLDQHPNVEIKAVSSRSAAGKLVGSQVSSFSNSELCFSHPGADSSAALKCDIYFLAMPNNISKAYVEAIRAVNPDAILIDLSFDHRMQSSQMGTKGRASTWVYGQSELNKKQLSSAVSISNPGCYATAALLALYPMQELIAGKPSVFGVSGYSGAGSTPSPKNDPVNLKDNFLPYALSGHLHEQEISKHLGHPVNFMPHVAPHFQGLSVTVNMELQSTISLADVIATYTRAYRRHALIEVREEIPSVKEIAQNYGAIIGGFSIDERDYKNVRVVCILDNLLKGAAVQAIQNMNLALGLVMNTSLKKATQ